LLSDVIDKIQINMQQTVPTAVPKQFDDVILGSDGITPMLAILVMVCSFFVTLWWEETGRQQSQKARTNRTTQQNKRLRQTAIGLGVILMLILPFIIGRFLTEVVDQVGTFILMGIGLNIVVGYAGLLDLGYVAFYAIGAYVMGFLISAGELGLVIPGCSQAPCFTFWMALPISVLAAVLAGIILGFPVLRMRGDYLAIVTLGFGEIIRVLVTSDLLKPVIGGAQGILKIGRPVIPIPDFLRQFLEGLLNKEIPEQWILKGSEDFYYLILVSCILALIIAWRLRDTRPGRQWMAMREDEDVAEAMGIHLVGTKLLAFAIGAAFAGLAGAIFSTRIASIFPASFQLIISINALSLIIVGGIGSLPGVVVGALFLVGLPELLREFQEYRLLMYGAVLIAMMLVRPEGIWPSPIRRREHHADDEAPVQDDTLLVSEEG
jgi:branched-chain amino acid transport system permease protein